MHLSEHLKEHTPQCIQKGTDKERRAGKESMISNIANLKRPQTNRGWGKAAASIQQSPDKAIGDSLFQ